ncbi:ATP-binding protein [Streptomyces galilaeus]|uniref:ATP-binding protein n=1 Tax=Streptomyces galilaeus TaxID=33899 RepID=UPI0019CD25E2|nr:ATP-binding protein [Streptomyces galilaeus]GGW85245.1 hypothetical protein GCM10010350_82290 [Streptomyces galilaeus]
MDADQLALVPGRSNSDAVAPRRDTYGPAPAEVVSEPGRSDSNVMYERLTITNGRSGVSGCGRDAYQIALLRRIAAERLKHCGLQALQDDALLIVTELLTNALLHSGTTEIHLKLSVARGFLHITVIDGVPADIALVPTGEEAESGRGLILVAALAQDHGGAFGISNGGATAWCTLALGPEERS